MYIFYFTEDLLLLRIIFLTSKPYGAAINSFFHWKIYALVSIFVVKISNQFVTYYKLPLFQASFSLKKT